MFHVDCIFFVLIPFCLALLLLKGTGEVVYGVCVCVCVCVCWCVCVCARAGYHFWEMDDCRTARPAYLWVNDITNSLLNALPRQIGLSCPLWWLILPSVNFIPSLSLSFSNLEMLLLKFGTKGGGWRTRNRT